LQEKVQRYTLYKKTDDFWNAAVATELGKLVHLIFSFERELIVINKKAALKGSR
jgi:hypothetical protein